MKTIPSIASVALLVAASTSFVALGCADDHDHATGETTLVVTVSGEESARSGYAFPPSGAEAIGLADGWALTFDHLIVSIGEVTLSETPDLSPTDQSKTGAVVARARGPWVIDLAKKGEALDPPLAVTSLRTTHGAPPATGRGSAADEAVRLVEFANLNVAGRDFDPSVRYALGFSSVSVTDGATRITGADAATAALLEEMKSTGASMAYVGTAVWKGGSACTSSDPSYDWSAFPKRVSFKFLFKAPVDLVNCQNTDLEGKAFDGEERQRGVQLKAGQANFNQLTFHNDHAFWLTADHEAAVPFFDQIAAAARSDGRVTLDDLATLDPTAFKDKAGRNLPWRSCLASLPTPSGPRRVDANGFGVSFDATKGPKDALRNYAEAVTYVTATQGHLNDDGLCAVTRRYDSP